MKAIILLFLPFFTLAQTKVLTDDGTKISWQPLVTSGSTTLDQILGINNTISKAYNFMHDATSNHIRYVTPNNYGTVYEDLTAGRFSETLTRVDGVNSDNRPNFVWMWGYNQNGGGGRENPTDASYHWAIETHFRSNGRLIEDHKQITTTSGQVYRIQSFTINKDNGANLLYFTSGAVEVRDTRPDIPAYWAIVPSTMDIMSLDNQQVQVRMHDKAGNTSGLRQVDGNMQVHTGNDMEIIVNRALVLPQYIRFNSGGSWNTNGHVQFNVTAPNQHLEIWGSSECIAKFINNGYANRVEIQRGLYVGNLNDQTGISKPVVSTNGVLSLGSNNAPMALEKPKKGISGTFKNVKSITVVNGIITSIR